MIKAGSFNRRGTLTLFGQRKPYGVINYNYKAQSTSSQEERDTLVSIEQGVIETYLSEYIGEGSVIFDLRSKQEFNVTGKVHDYIKRVSSFAVTCQTM